MATRSEVTLETDRLVLREPRDADASAVCAYHARNAERFERWEPPRSRREAEHGAWIAAVRTEADRIGHAATFLCFVRPRTTMIAGIVTLSGFSAIPPSAMVSYSIDADYEGRGVASEALRCVVAYAFDRIGLRTLSAYYDPANARSERLLVRAGFTLAGRMPILPGFEHAMRSSAVAMLAR